MEIRLVVLLSCLLSAALLGAGCNFTEVEFREPLGTIEMDLASERTLEPSEITLDQPGTYLIRAENVTDDVAHALEIESTEGSKVNYKEGSVRTEDLRPGASAPEFKVHLEPGTYEISCPVSNHREQGMRGTITVEEG